MASSDFDRYAERIGYRGPRALRDDVLSEIHRAHATSIPFENLDIHLRVPIRLEAEHLFDKLVVRKRGGYCFEQNGLLLEMLRTLGFVVRPLAARVTFGLRDAAPVVRPRTHMLLLVDIGGRAFVADVGFGTHNLLGAIPFETDREHEVHGEVFRLRRAAPELALEVRLDAGWVSLYTFTLEDQLPVDFMMASYFTSTHPESFFVTNKVVSRPEIGRRHVLLNDELRVHQGGATETRRIEGEADYRAVLRTTFGLELPEP